MRKKIEHDNTPWILIWGVVFILIGFLALGIWCINKDPSELWTKTQSLESLIIFIGLTLIIVHQIKKRAQTKKTKL